MGFYDKHYNVLPNSFGQETSENPSTFNAALYFSLLFNKKKPNLPAFFTLFMYKYTTNNFSWRTMEYDENSDWSLDEKISACAFFAYNDVKGYLKVIPLFTKDISHYRPDVFLYVLGSKYKWLRPFCYPLINIKMNISMGEFKEDPVGQSSGAQLAFIKAMGWGDIEFVTKHDWKPVFASYYPQKEHPTRMAWEMEAQGE